jgi:superfamily II DNA or RNA helicase
MEATQPNPPKAPEVGQAVRVRNRLATVRAVEPYDTRTEGRLNIVDVEYLDDFRYPESEQLLWEVESTAIVLGKTSLPGVDEHRPDSPDVLQAFINAHRWTRLNRLREGDGIEDEPLLGIWNSAIQVHYYQLDPVIRALSMPRVSLLLCDGVGLGKTIQCGLVLEELLLRRRIRRVLVICPAMLQRQWKYELRRKFNLDFEIIDSDSTFQLRRRLGIDTNPWKAFPRIITSMDYLRMPDVLDQFLQASGVGPGVETDGRTTAHAPWDLLIVDECHHFAPQSGSRASQRTRMLREIRFLFEHRIFASATPHNGKTVCFTGLLELLDPIRFQMFPEMDDQDKANLAEVRIRRLKDDINKQSLRPLFAEQLDPEEIPVRMSDQESALFAALREYRKKGHDALGDASAAERWVGEFVYSLLTKRLLSCPYAFARTWWRHLEASEESEDATLFDMARVSAERAEEQAKSDDERTMLEDDAARYAGAWFRSQSRSGIEPLNKVSQALESLGLGKKVAEDEGKLAALARKADSKTEALIQWIKKNLFVNGKLRDDERLLLFTEYKESLFFLEQRLLQEGFDKNTLRLLYGGMDADDFEAVKSEFEDRTAAVRLLLATDAASEGINMQEECRWVIHYDVPWSPSKLQQRNGRVARHGQVRDVSTFYFCCDQEEDLAFLLKVAKKVEQVKQDLGSVERVFNAAIQRHFKGQAISFDRVSELVDQQIAESPEQKELSHSSPAEVADLTRRAKELLESTETRLGISPQALIDIMQAAITVEGQGSLEEIAGKSGFYRLKPPPRWEGLARQTLTVGSRTDRMELVFDSALVEQEPVPGRRVLRLKKYQTLMRLGHPILRQAMATLCRQLHDPQGHNAIFRWSIAGLRHSGFEALLAFQYTVTAINELREPLHDEVVATVFRVEGNQLTPVEDEFQQTVLHSEFHPIKSAAKRDDWWKVLRGHWFQHKEALEAFLRQQESEVKSVFERRAETTLERELQAAKESYQFRLRELQDRSREQALRRIAKELVRQRVETQQLALFEEIQEEAEMGVRELEEQIAVLRQDVERTRELLTRERDNRIKVVLPKRFQLREVRVLPLAMTYLVPAAAEDLQP